MLNDRDSGLNNYTKEQRQIKTVQRSFGRFTSEKCFLGPRDHAERVVSDIPEGTGKYAARSNINTKFFANDRFEEELVNQCTGDLKMPLALPSQLTILPCTNGSSDRKPINGIGCLPLAVQPARVYFHGIMALNFGGHPSHGIWFPHDKSTNSIFQDLFLSFSKSCLRDWIGGNHNSAAQTSAPRIEHLQSSQLVGGWFTFVRLLTMKSFLDPGDNVEKLFNDVPEGSGYFVLRFKIKMKSSTNDEPEETLINHFANDTKIALAKDNQITIPHLYTDNADQESVAGRGNLPLAAQLMQVFSRWARALGTGGYFRCKIWLARDKPASIGQGLDLSFGKSSLPIWVQNMRHQEYWDAGYFIHSDGETGYNTLKEKIPLMPGAQCSLWWRSVMSGNSSLDGRSSTNLIKCQEKYPEIGEEWPDRASSFANTRSSVHLPSGRFLGRIPWMASVLAPASCLCSAAFCGASGSQNAVTDNCILLHWKEVQHGYLMWSQPKQSDRRWIESLIEKHWQVAWDHWSQWEQRGAE